MFVRLKCDAFTFQPYTLIFRIEVTFICLDTIKGNNCTPCYLPWIYKKEQTLSILFIKSNIKNGMSVYFISDYILHFNHI